MPAPENHLTEIEQEEDSDKQSLPTFPDSPSHNKFSEAMIKEAVGVNEEITLPPIPGIDGRKEIKVVEMEEWKPGSESDSNIPALPEDESDESHSRFMHPDESQTSGQNEGSNFARRIVSQSFQRQPLVTSNKTLKNESGKKEVFVRIDRYYSARKSISDIAKRMEEIDEMVRKIREVKLREEQEIASWERDIADAKLKIQEVSNLLFEKLE